MRTVGPRTLNLTPVNIVRSLERRLERLLDGVAGRVFSGALHPAELAGKLAREADFARFDHPTGPATANSFTVMVNHRDLDADSDSLQASLAAELSRYAADEGLRLEGPVSVAIETSDKTPPGTVMCHVEVVPGPPTPWAKLVSRGETHQVGRNRTLLGRDPEADLVLPHDEISRRHALIWREQGSAWIRDLGSSNGTLVSGKGVGYAPTRLSHGSVVVLAGHEYRFLEG
jgi:hypothetical protein